MANPTVLIVGAGALGILTGYHLQLAGADITFFVRENRLAALGAPQILYCYDDGTLKSFSSYRTATDLGTLAQTRFDYVLVTLDGAACLSEEGTKLLAGIGDLIRESDAVIIVGGVGVRSHYLATTRLPAHRIVEGTLGCLAYQTDRVIFPLHPPTDPATLAKSSLAYHHLQGGPGFFLAAAPRPAAEAFAALYTLSKVSRAKVVSASLFAIISTAFFPMTAICDLAGWPDAATLSANTPLMRNSALAWLLRKMEQAALPIDFSAFNHFHHGGKVRAQDLQVLRNCLAAGLARGRKMAALGELVARYEAHCAAPA